jgi:nucleotide-binding universal stress UspA family protein
MYRYRQLLVGLTRTETDAGLLRYAAMVARLGTASEVRFVHVLPTPASPAGAPSERVTDELWTTIRAHFTGVPATLPLACDVVSGPLVDRLLTYVAEHEIDLLLVGHRRSHPGRWALARRLAMKAPCSVWMVPEGSPTALDRILVPIDFSEHTADTLQVATDMARRVEGAECLALHVYFNEAAVTYEEYDQVLRGQEAEAFRRFVAPINTQGVPIRPLFEEGANVTHIINRVAEREAVDVTVMATRGRSRSAAILLGSVTEETIMETRVPLLVVKHFGARMGVLQALLDRGFRQKRDPHFD